MSKPKDVMQVPAKDVMEKLSMLQLHNAKGMHFTNQIFRYMADPKSGYLRESDLLMPEIFLMVFNSCIADCLQGVNSHTHKRIDTYFAGYEARIYSFVWLDVPAVADQIFPADFASEVKAAVADLIEASRKTHAEA